MKTITKDLLDVARFASKNPCRAVLTCVCISNEEIVATDSYSLLVVKRDNKAANDIDEFPLLTGYDPVKKLKGPVLLNAKQILDNFKMKPSSGLPILSDAILANETKDKITLVRTDLSGDQALQLRKCEGTFPDWKKVLVKKATDSIVEVSVDANILMEALKAFKQKGGKGYVKLKITDLLNPLVIEGGCSENEHKTAYIMPLKI